MHFNCTYHILYYLLHTQRQDFKFALYNYDFQIVHMAPYLIIYVL